MSKEKRYSIFVALVVSIGGFLFGFDASVISGVTGFIVPEFDLNEWQQGFAVACLTLTATVAMLTSGPISNKYGRKKVLLFVGLFYAASALLSALAPNYAVLVLARMLGGLAVGAALILAPMYIAEIAPAGKRGKLVSINQLNIVLGFSAAYFCNYYLLQLSGSDAHWVKNLSINDQTWRWMLGLELIPALLYFILMFLVPESPRWLIMKGNSDEARIILSKINGEKEANRLVDDIEKGIDENKNLKKASLKDLFAIPFKLVLAIGLVVGILQQITGVNAIYFYATSIFEQSGIGKNAAFSQAVWVGIINVIFTLVAMALIDRIGRRPLLMIGVTGIAISMCLVSFGFSQATYELKKSNIPASVESTAIADMIDVKYTSDVAFKKDLKSKLGNIEAARNEAELLRAAVTMDSMLILIGILSFVASFAISLGPVMWVLLSEIFPNRIRGIAISFVGFVNSVVSYLVQQFFPWELNNLGNSVTYLIYALFAIIGLFFVYRILPETKGKSLEELEHQLIKDS